MASSQGSAILGWDIGGVNTKAVRLEDGERDLSRVRALSAAYELQRNPAELVPTLRRLAGALGHREGASHAVTMTAELSQAFRTKRQGVAFVLSAVRTAFPEDEILVYTVSGRFLSPEQACDCPLDVGASNWAATARLAGRLAGDCMLIDTGSTTTDVIPVLAGEPAVEGATDPARLLSGELVYTGALRTPAEAVTSELPLWDGRAAVAAEGFALIGDAHLWLGSLRSEDYTVPTPDGRPATREYAGERIARSVCGDREMLDASAIDRIAAALAEAQVAQVTAALRRVLARHPSITKAVVTGLGDFIAAAAAERAGLQVLPLSDWLNDAARIAPAAAVAWLLAEARTGSRE